MQARYGVDLVDAVHGDRPATVRRLWVLVKGAMEDPALAREMSPTGFTLAEEFQAATIESLASLVNVTLRANFKEPAGGWPKPASIPRPKDVPRVSKTKQTTAKDITRFMKKTGGDIRG